MRIKGTVAATVALLMFMLALPTITGPTMAESFCGPQSAWGTRAADPAALATAWLPRFERLYASIPDLSPRESQWLDSERRGNGRRPVHAVSSREFALQSAKFNAGSLLASLRNLSNEKRGRAEQTQDWLFFAYTLIDEDADLHLARLVTERVIPADALPEEWKSLASGETMELQESIRWARMSLARHVLICTLANRLPEK